MDVIGPAVADLRFSLETASEVYRDFADLPQSENHRVLLLELSSERSQDAHRLRQTDAAANLNPAEPSLTKSTALQLLSISQAAARSVSSMAYSVQRSENTLERLAAQIQTFASQSGLQTALQTIRTRIAARRPDVQAFRRAAAAYSAADRLAAGPPAGDARLPKTPGQTLDIWFATNRAMSRSGKFIGQRAEHVSYGKCTVFVPADRRVGSIGTFFGRLIHGDGKIRVTETVVMAPGSFWSDISANVSQLDKPERHALVYLHGYCVKFDEAARRTAQLKADLGHQGPAAFFSWPSLGTRFAYPGDVAANEGSEPVIREFLVDFAEKSGADAVHIIAHSMGNRALLRAMDTIARDAAAATKVRFGQIILAAPDVDRQLFANLASAYAALSERSTLYVSENDLAIGVSSKIHRYNRAGLAPPMTIVPGIDTVNVSNVNLDFLGHSYATEMRPVLSDIHELLKSNTPPGRRFGIRQAGQPGSLYWEFAR